MLQLRLWASTSLLLLSATIGTAFVCPGPLLVRTSSSRSVIAANSCLKSWCRPWQQHRRGAGSMQAMHIPAAVQHIGSLARQALLPTVAPASASYFLTRQVRGLAQINHREVHATCRF